ncbi:uncharacterized protein LOC135317627 isoform X1 [Phalacrocorax carbo]|uniref:uncharacterized protein LOC135317627 isoform X1 n=2 Tax=Phalacrocorax carbo TaxID=9209 RepID=UPI00311A0FF3
MSFFPLLLEDEEGFSGPPRVGPSWRAASPASEHAGDARQRHLWEEFSERTGIVWCPNDERLVPSPRQVDLGGRNIKSCFSTWAGAAGLWARRKGEAWKQLATKTFREATKARSKAQIRRFLGPAAGAGRAVTGPAAAPERPRSRDAPAMAAEVLYADLRLPVARSPPAGRQHAPALCPQWHGVLLKVGGLGHLVLLALVAVLSVQVFQGSLQPATTCAPRPGSEIWGRNRTERCLVSSLMRYFCEPRQETPAASAGCRLCPQGWQLHGERCYRLSKEKGSWTQGKKDCENQKSHLVVLRDKKEEEHVKNITGGRTQPVWVGLTSSEKKWRWVDNTTLDANTFSALKEAGEGCWTLKGEA